VCDVASRSLLDIKYAIGARRFPRLKQSDGHIVHRNSGCRLTIWAPMMGMAVHNQICAVTIDHFRQSRGSKIGKDLRRFTLHRRGDR